MKMKMGLLAVNISERKYQLTEKKMKKMILF